MFDLTSEDLNAQLSALERMLLETEPRESPATPPERQALNPPRDAAVVARWIIDALGVPIEVRCYSTTSAAIVQPLLAALPPATAPRHRFEVWGTDRLYLSRDGAEIYQGVPPDILASGLVSGMTAIAGRAPRRTLAVHASAVARNDRVVVIGGHMNQGKSSTALHLVESGWDFLTDELVELDASSGRVTGLARPIAVEGYTRRSRPDLRPAWLPEDGREPHRWMISPASIGNVIDSGTLSVLAVLSFAGAPTAVTPLTTIEAVAELSALVFNRDAVTPDTLAALGRLVDGVLCVRVRHAGAASAAAAIERLAVNGR